jgi:hypothetical protein
LEDIEHAVDAVISQTIHSSLLPVESIKKKIPLQTRVSILTPIIKAFMSPSESYIEYKLAEYHPAFNIHHVVALPMQNVQTEDGGYLEFDLEEPLVALNGMGESFVYIPGICQDRLGFTVCPSHQIEVHTKPIYCVEALVQLTVESLNICLKSMYIARTIPNQRFIYLEDFTKVRLFSPFQDAASTLCGANFTRNISTIAPGYTDIMTNSDCTVYTSQMKILSPVPPSDETTIQVDFFIPNMTAIMDSLMDDIEVVHALNLSTLFQDYKTFEKDLLIDKQKVSDVQISLNKTKAIKTIEDFDMMSIDFKNIHQPSEQVKVVGYLSMLAVFAVIIILCWLCCPACCTNAVINVIRIVWRAISTSAITVYRGVLSAVQYFRNRTQLPMGPQTSDEEDEEDVVFQRGTDNVQLRRRQQQSGLQGILRTSTNRLNRMSVSNHDGPSENRLAPEASSTPIRAQSYMDVRRNLNVELERAGLSTSTRTIDNVHRYENVPTQDIVSSQLEVQTLHPAPISSAPPQSPLEKPKDYDWTIQETQPNRCVLRCQQRNIQMSFVPETYQVYTDLGFSMKGCDPPQELIDKYMTKYYSLPETKLSEMKQMDSSWEYDKEIRAFHRNVKGMRIYRFGHRVSQTTLL